MHASAYASALDERNKAIEELRTLVDQSQGRHLTDAELRTESDLNAKIEELDEVVTSGALEIARSSEQRDAEANLHARLNGRRTDARMGEPLTEGRSFTDLPEAKLDGQALDLRTAGEYVAAVATGDTSLLPTEYRAQSIGTANKGGHAVPTPVASSILDLVRARTRVIEAGATVTPLPSATYKVPKVDNDPSPAWRDEAAAVAESDMTLGAVTFTARSLGVLVKLSLELLEDAPNVGETLANSLASAFANEVDRVSLVGSGSAPQPQGLFGASGVDITYLGTNGGAIDWDDVIAARAAVEGDNFPVTAALMAPRTQAALAVLKGTANDHYLSAPAYASAFPHLATAQVPVNQTRGTANNASFLALGDFSQLHVGIRTEFTLKGISEAYLATGQVGVVGWLRADVQIARPDAFQIIVGIVPA
jgi:HK97 family phage major capsid protein